jgi:hypothetical protein
MEEEEEENEMVQEEEEEENEYAKSQIIRFRRCSAPSHLTLLTHRD